MYRLRLGGPAALLIAILVVAPAGADDAATCIAKGNNAIAACDDWNRQQPKNAVPYWHRGVHRRFAARAASIFVPAN
jgi:hypothetical protein